MYTLHSYNGRLVIEDDAAHQIIGVAPIVQRGRGMTEEVREYMVRARTAMAQMVAIMNEGDEIQRRQCAPEFAGVHVDTMADYTVDEE